MKSILILSMSLILISCGGSSNNTVEPFSTPTNFSEKKFNEDLVGQFAIPEMKKVIAALDSIKSRTSNCKVDLDYKNLKADWRKAAFAYQSLRPIESLLLDRNPQTVLKLQERYLDGAYSVGNCRIQLNTSNQSLLESSLTFDPAINSLEFLIYGDVDKTNYCNAAGNETVADWLLSENKSEDVCNHINFIAEISSAELTEINRKNEVLYNEGESNQIFPDNNLQSVYDSISVYTDQVLKDKTVGQPLGLSSKCPFPGRTCPTAIEHEFSQITFEAVSKNLEGIMAIYNQQTAMTEAPLSKGLYQFLLANKKKQVADELYKNLLQAHRLSSELHGQNFTQIAAALDGADKKEECTDTTVENKKVPACALFKSIKSLSDKVKLDLRLALSVSSTKQIEGDSD